MATYLHTNTCPMQVTGGRNGYGAKLANIFSTEFTIETCDGQRQRKYKQVRGSSASAPQPRRRCSGRLTPGACAS